MKKTHQNCYYCWCSISMNNYYSSMWKSLLHLFVVISKTCCTRILRIGENMVFQSHTATHTHTRSEWTRERERGIPLAAVTASVAKEANIIYSKRGKNPISTTTAKGFISLFLYGTFACICVWYIFRIWLLWGRKRIPRARSLCCIQIHVTSSFFSSACSVRTLFWYY